MHCEKRLRRSKPQPRAGLLRRKRSRNDRWGNDRWVGDSSQGETALDPRPGALGPLDPGQLADDTSDLFLGIGSVLDARHSEGRRKIVAGAGFGGYEAPASLDGSWEIYWVRGPRTAGQLGLRASFGLGDPASLLPLVHPIARHAIGTVGFMPHFESLVRGAWPQAASAAGVTLIDPRDRRARSSTRSPAAACCSARRCMA